MIEEDYRKYSDAINVLLFDPQTFSKQLLNLKVVQTSLFLIIYTNTGKQSTTVNVPTVNVPVHACFDLQCSLMFALDFPGD